MTRAGCSLIDQKRGFCGYLNKTMDICIYFSFFLIALDVGRWTFNDDMMFVHILSSPRLVEPCIKGQGMAQHAPY